MDATVTLNEPEAATAPVRKRRAIASAKPVAPGSMRRANRWKRRGISTQNRRIAMFAGLGFAVVALIIILRLTATPDQIGPDGPLAKVAFEAFPEADPQRIEIYKQNDLPVVILLHVPAHMIEPSRGARDPFAILGAEFGRAERTLSGVEMAARIEQVSAALLPDDMVRCHTYKVGGISSAPEVARQTRLLMLHLNPEC